MTAFSSNGPHDDARCVQQKFVKNALYFIICMFVRTYVRTYVKHKNIILLINSSYTLVPIDICYSIVILLSTKNQLNEQYKIKETKNVTPARK